MQINTNLEFNIINGYIDKVETIKKVMKGNLYKVIVTKNDKFIKAFTTPDIYSVGNNIVLFENKKYSLILTQSEFKDIYLTDFIKNFKISKEDMNCEIGYLIKTEEEWEDVLKQVNTLIHKRRPNMMNDFKKDIDIHIGYDNLKYFEYGCKHDFMKSIIPQLDLPKFIEPDKKFKTEYSKKNTHFWYNCRSLKVSWEKKEDGIFIPLKKSISYDPNQKKPAFDKSNTDNVDVVIKRSLGNSNSPHYYIYDAEIINLDNGYYIKSKFPFLEIDKVYLKFFIPNKDLTNSKYASYTDWHVKQSDYPSYFGERLTNHITTLHKNRQLNALVTLYKQIDVSEIQNNLKYINTIIIPEEALKEGKFYSYEFDLSQYEDLSDFIFMCNKIPLFCYTKEDLYQIEAYQEIENATHIEIYKYEY